MASPVVTEWLRFESVVSRASHGKIAVVSNKESLNRSDVVSNADIIGNGADGPESSAAPRAEVPDEPMGVDGGAATVPPTPLPCGTCPAGGLDFGNLESTEKHPAPARGGLKGDACGVGHGDKDLKAAEEELAALLGEEQKMEALLKEQNELEVLLKEHEELESLEILLRQTMFEEAQVAKRLFHVDELAKQSSFINRTDTALLDKSPKTMDPILMLPTLRLGSVPTSKDAVVAPPPSQLEPAAEVVAAGSDLSKSEASKGTCMVEELPGSSQEVCKGSATQEEPAKTNSNHGHMAPDVLQHRPAVLQGLAPISPAEQSKTVQPEEEEGHDEDSEESEDPKPKQKKRKAAAKSKACPKPKPKAKAKGKAAKAKGKAAKEVEKPKRNTRKAKSSESKPVEDLETSATKRPRKSSPKQAKRKASAPSAPGTPDSSPPKKGATASNTLEKDAKKAETKARYSRKSAAYVKAYKAGLKDGLEEEDARQKGKDVSRSEQGYRAASFDRSLHPGKRSMDILTPPGILPLNLIED
eukprot:s3629_g2.t1